MTLLVVKNQPQIKQNGKASSNNKKKTKHNFQGWKDKPKEK